MPLVMEFGKFGALEFLSSVDAWAGDVVFDDISINDSSDFFERIDELGYMINDKTQ